MSTQTITTLPETGFIRLAQVLQFIPLGKTRWYAGIQSGEFPRPIKHGRAALYRVEDIKALIKRMGEGA